ncbi:hypothetical protein SEEN0624_15437, partial [Salmonella enterica subsp. enterica serovar Newport str. PRS_2010_0624]
QYRADAVYPRWRGEHGNRLHTLRNESGLSPLARGTHRNAIRSNLTDRFIPAGAGNTGTMNGSALMPAVYPRWRGEK